MDRGVDANAVSGAGGHCLARAAGRGDKDMVNLLLKKGAEVNARGTGRSGHFHTPLIAACNSGEEDLVRLLLNHGADVNAWDEEDGKWSSFVGPSDKRMRTVASSQW